MSDIQSIKATPSPYRVGFTDAPPDSELATGEYAADDDRHGCWNAGGSKHSARNLAEAQAKPHVLDDYTVGRVLKVYGEQQDFVWVYEAQLERWQQETLTAAQQQQTEQMAAQLAQLKPGLSEILEIAETLKGKPLNRCWAKVTRS